MVAQGLREAGYTYAVVDGGWRDNKLGTNFELLPNYRVSPRHEAAGRLRPFQGLEIRRIRSPAHMIAAVTGWARFTTKRSTSRNLPIGASISSRWTNADAKGVGPEDLVKSVYMKWSDLLAHDGRDITFSISAYKYRDWYPQACNMARTTGDIACRITRGGAQFDKDARYHSVMAIADENNKVAFAGNGYWNIDPDMLVTGDHGLNQDEQRSHFALWYHDCAADARRRSAKSVAKRKGHHP